MLEVAFLSFLGTSCFDGDFNFLTRLKVANADTGRASRWFWNHLYWRIIFWL